MPSFIKIGQIVNTHGLNGEVKIYPLTDNLDRFDNLEEVYIAGIGTPLKIEKIWRHKQFVIAKFKSYNTIDKAKRLKNRYLLISEDELAELEEGTYYIFELEGLYVYLENGELLGKIKEVLQPGANDVYVVENEDKTYYIPAIKDVVLSTDIKKNKMIIRPMEGLL